MMTDVKKKMLKDFKERRNTKINDFFSLNSNLKLLKNYNILYKILKRI